MKKLLLLGSELGKGGAERSISLLSYYLQQEGYDVTLCLLSGKDREQYYKTCEQVVFVDPPSHNNPLGKIMSWKYRFDRIREIKRRQKIDVAISFLEGPDYINLLTSGSEKTVISIRGSKIHDKEISGLMGTVRKKILMPWLYKKADKVVCVTDALSTEMAGSFGIKESRLTTIFNFYEPDEILKAAEEPLSEEEQRIFDKPVIINSGRLHIQKEHDKLIRIFHRVKKSRDCRLMILGDGGLKSSLIALAGELSLSICDWQSGDRSVGADIYLMGFQKNAFKFYRHSTLFALSSSWEGFPNVLAEALICGLPVVTTDCPTGPREIMNVQPPETPIKKAMRLQVGSLMPLLQQIEEPTELAWEQEMLYWLKAVRPDKAAFSALTKRFTREDVIMQWKNLIDN